LKKDIGKESRKDRKYDPNEGFVVHWDYVLGLP